MNITQALQQGQQLRPAKLNDAIRAVVTKEWVGRHDAATVIIDCDPVDEAAIRSAIASHLATDWAAQEEAERVRLAAVDDAIKQDNVIQQIAKMTAAEYDAWWAANVTTAAQAITVLKRVVRVLCRKLL